MKAFQWHYAAASGRVFVDGNFGSDSGDGTQQKPFKTLERAYNLASSKPSSIICRGLLHGDIQISNHSCQIIGDRFGDAVFDGEGTNVLQWFGAVSNMIFINCLSNITVNTSLSNYASSKYAAFSGVGRAVNGGNLHAANYGYGVGSSPVLIHNSKIFRGQIGGSTGGVIYSHIVRPNPANVNHKVVLGTYGNNLLGRSTAYYCKVYDPANPSAVVRGRKNSDICTIPFLGERWLFAEFDIFVDEPYKDSFHYCYFAADCNFVFKNNNVEYAIRLGDPTAEKSYTLNNATVDDPNGWVNTCLVDGCESIPEAAAYLKAQGVSSGNVPTFNDCKFGTCRSAQIFNNAEALDFTLRPDSDAVDDADGSYYGYLKPALNVAIYDNENDTIGSDGHLNCWDNRTANGCVAIEDGKICYDETVTRGNDGAVEGSIYSKIIKINPRRLQFNGIYSFLTTKKNEGVILSDKDCYGEAISAGTGLTAGCTYKVLGGAGVVYSIDSTTYGDKNTILCNDEGATFSQVDSANPSRVYEIADPNLMDCVKVRCRSQIYATAQSGDTLYHGVWYLNNCGHSITFHGRTIIDGESFMPSIDETWTDADENATIAIMFDDRETENPLVPATEFTDQTLWGEEWVAMGASGVNKDSDNEYLSSGNYKAYAASSNTKVLGTGGVSTPLNEPYIQLALFVNKL